MKKKYLHILLNILMASIVCQSLLHAQSPASMTQRTQEKQQCHNIGMPKLDQTGAQDSTQKPSDAQIQKVQKPQTTPAKQSASTKPNKKPKQKLISKKEFKQYLKTALTVLGTTGAILIMISDRALEYIIGGAPKAVGFVGISASNTNKKNSEHTHDLPPQKPKSLSKQVMDYWFPLSQKDLENQKRDATAELFTGIILDKEMDLQSLIERNADVNSKCIWQKSTPLFYAATQNNVSVIKQLLHYKANIDATSQTNEETPLMAAAHNNHFEAVQALIEGRANVDAQSREGFSALHYAVDVNNPAIVELLLKNNANPNSVTKNGYTALLLSFKNPNGSEEMIDILLTNQAAQASINLQDSYGYTALFWAVLRKKSSHTVKTLLDHNADANTTNNNGTTPLMKAALQGKNDIIDMLIHHNANPYAVNNTQENALMKAVINNHAQAISLLLSHGLPIDAVDSKGETALMKAAQHKSCDAVRVLLDAKADLNTTERRNGNTPLHLTTQNCAFQKNKPQYRDITEALLNAHADIHARNNSGTTPLHYAAHTGCADTVQLLLDSNADINAKDNDGHTPADYARTKPLKRLLGVPEEDLVDVPDEVENSDSESDWD